MSANITAVVVALIAAALVASSQPTLAQTDSPTPTPTSTPVEQPITPTVTTTPDAAAPAATPGVTATVVATAAVVAAPTAMPSATLVQTATAEAAQASVELDNGYKLGQHAHVFETKIGKRAYRLNYWLYLPQSYGQDPYAKYPLIVFLHGSRELGKDVNKVKKAILPARLDTEADFPAIVLSPQSPVQGWDSSVPAITALIDELEADLSIDIDREYVTGLSMGAYGAWALAMKNQDRFAAIISVVGGYYYNAKQLCALKDVPIWVFAGKKDRNVNPKESVAIVSALEGCGGKPRFTFYEDANHDQGWQRAYTDPEFFAWLLEQRKGSR